MEKMFAIKNTSEKDNVTIILHNIEFSAKQTSCARNQILYFPDTLLPWITLAYIAAHGARSSSPVLPWKIQFSWAKINLYRISWSRVEMYDVTRRFDICGFFPYLNFVPKFANLFDPFSNNILQRSEKFGIKYKNRVGISHFSG